MTISNEDVQDILRLLDTLPFSELTLETGRFTLRLQRAADGGWSQETQVLSRPVAAAGPAADGRPGSRRCLRRRPAPAPARAPAAGSTHGRRRPGARTVRAPLPGTFYRAPQPGAPPYVEVGSQVDGRHGGRHHRDDEADEPRLRGGHRHGQRDLPGRRPVRGAGRGPDADQRAGRVAGDAAPRPRREPGGDRRPRGPDMPAAGHRDRSWPCSDADLDSLPARLADRTVRIGPAPPAGSYLNTDAVVAAAVAVGAEAIHPGYGFLSENPRLAQACDAAGLVFIGPPAAQLGDGRRQAGRPRSRRPPRAYLCWLAGRSVSAGEAESLAQQIGWPVLVKAAGGGGGRGLRRVRTPAELAPAAGQAIAEARAAFGDPRIYLERFVTPRPAHRGPAARRRRPGHPSRRP